MKNFYIENPPKTVFLRYKQTQSNITTLQLKKKMNFENSTMVINNSFVLTNLTEENTVNTGENPVTIAIFICLGIIGCLGHGFVLYVFSSSEKLRKSIVNIYLINQSAIDLMASLMFIATAKGVTKSTGWSADRIQGTFYFSYQTVTNFGQGMATTLR